MGWIRRPPHPSIGDQLNDELISNGVLSITSSLSLTGSQYFIFAAKIFPQWAQMESLTSHMVRSTSTHACFGAVAENYGLLISIGMMKFRLVNKGSLWLF